MSTEIRDAKWHKRMSREAKRVWQAHNGPLPKGWHIHHIDGDRANNHIDNLYACTPEEHKHIHMQPEWQDRHSALMRAVYNDPVVKANHAAAMKTRRGGRMRKAHMCWVWSKYKAYPLGSGGRMVICIETGETWYSLRQATAAIGCDKRSLTQRSAEGYSCKKGRTYMVI